MPLDALTLAAILRRACGHRRPHRRAGGECRPAHPAHPDVHRRWQDLAVSKPGRFSSQDREDIRTLARSGLINADALRQRAEEALGRYIGNLDRLRGSIDIACKDIAAH